MPQPAVFAAFAAARGFCDAPLIVRFFDHCVGQVIDLVEIAFLPVVVLFIVPVEPVLVIKERALAFFIFLVFMLLAVFIDRKLVFAAVIVCQHSGIAVEVPVKLPDRRLERAAAPADKD